MHQSAMDLMSSAFDKYYRPEEHKTVVDLGSRVGKAGYMCHRAITDKLNVKYVGVDIEPGINVDVVMKRPYRIPLPANSADIVISGQVFEHVPYVWVTMLEMARIVRPGGYLFITAPSSGHLHAYPTDCWRFYPDGMTALGSFAQLKVLEAKTDFPSKSANGRANYAAVPGNRYWGDTLGVFQKPKNFRGIRIALVREVMVRWANQRPLKPPATA